MRWTRAALGGAALLLTGCSVDTSNDMQYEAKDACHHFVETHLKSPGTANYSDEAVTGSGDTWTCTGTVDAQNSFGGEVRNSYTLTIEKRADGKWYEVSLTGLTN